jgi:hypothetical protein
MPLFPSIAVMLLRCIKMEGLKIPNGTTAINGHPKCDLKIDARLILSN